jgi:hypothetical protein
LYADPGGVDCNILDSTGLINVYAVHTGTAGALGSQWAAPAPMCWYGVSWVSDTAVFPLTIGDSQNGVAIAYDDCKSGSVHILTITFFSTNPGSYCCQYPVVPDPSLPSGEIEVVDCGSNPLYGQGTFATINGDASCPCGEAEHATPQSVVASGGEDIASGSYGIRGTVGQATIGTIASETMGNRAGYWYNSGTTVTGTGDAQGDVPKAFVLQQNYPNPFNPSTTIRFSVPRPSRVSLKIYDVKGRLVETLVNRDMPAGDHEAVWNAGRRASGVYFSRFEAPGYTQTRKLVLLK